MTILHLLSTFPSLTETFVLREIRELRKIGLNVVIGQIRPLHRTPPAKGFEDLSPFVNGAGWFSLDMLKGFILFSFLKPRQLLECFRTTLRTVDRPKDFVKALYVLMSSIRLAYCLRKTPIQLVRANFLHTEALAARYTKSLLGVPYAITVHTVTVYFRQRVIDDVVENATFFIADTNEARAFLLAMKVPLERIHLIRNGVSLDEFPLRRGQPVVGPPIILGVGTLIPKKGFHVLLSACAVLRERGIPFRCVIIGDGDERARLTNLRKELGLEGSVEMLGYLSLAELRDWYYRATIFAMPSVVSPTGETDGLPTVVIEALASGLPVVGTDTAGIPEVIHDGVNGLLVPANTPERLADAMQMLLERGDLREKFCYAGRQLVEREFSLNPKVQAARDLILEHVLPRSVRKFSGPFAEAVP
jgi:glycosyltransferase involved in cell wall biosynthesis